MFTTRKNALVASLAAIAVTGLAVAAQADSCSQARTDAKTASKQVVQFPVGTYRAVTTISNAVGNAYNCITDNPNTVQQERGESTTNSSQDSSSSSDSGSDDSGN